SRYGLSGAVTSGSLDRALSVARRIRTGTIAVNGGQWFGPDSPFGGYKESGQGREHGVAGFEEYLETKTVGLPPKERRRARAISGEIARRGSGLRGIRRRPTTCARTRR